ncbi:EAL domain-containing protein (putative c-di-GMP-specific phosphodiesterase class I) [Bacillus oleivorans]|uniref:EAL domain-containing protein (Putative c-di-GMP-specific phosphodiesterase class I) n=1 Tax=Bacillus oleivorans TaxID=1448271 RepID=A0A285D442_9BACI|nr:EAL-associated domain-containing protein [Bacillus oleivorans]SNX73903.1 EAL domain-containing protein (putative c-di-GMP-specific phosphodiesterase class I) [Bacillus oleivorans]
MNIDPLDIISNMNHLLPFYEPFFSAEDLQIVGYEVMGKFREEHTDGDLDSFFMDQQIPEEYRLEAYAHLINRALDHFIQAQQAGFLAFRMDPNILIYDVEETIIKTILSKKEAGFLPSQIIFVLPEESLKGIEGSIEHTVQFIKTFGIRIAIENAESSGVRLERIAPLSPHFIRVHLSSLKSQSGTIGFDETIYALSSFARKIGATLMFDKIEMEHQLMFAWKNGGRYYQGPLLAKSSAVFEKKDKSKELLKKELSRFMSFEKKKLEALKALETMLFEDLNGLLDKYKHNHAFEELILEAAKILKDRAFRLYVCDDDGYQLSSNLLRQGDQWINQKEYLQKNWSWRPYFLENVFKMSRSKQGLLSDLYSDIETGEWIRTFSIPITNRFFLFIDLSYSFLFEEENLL